MRGWVASLAVCFCVLAPVSGAGAGDLPCTADDALTRAAAALLLEGEAPESRALDAAVRDAGSDAVRLHALFVPATDEAAARQWLVELRRKSDAELACGDAQSERGRLLIASARAGTLAPLTAASGVVRGSLAPGFDHPELVIAEADGQLTRLGLEPSMLRDGVPLSEQLERPATVQLLARGPSGPRPVAERVLPGGTAERSERAPIAASASGVSDGASVDLASMLAELRRRHGRSAVRPNRLLQQVATQHAGQVCRQQRLAHQLAPGQDPEARLSQAGVQARVVGETIARAPDLQSAFHDLTQSPSHMLTLLEPRFTDAGVGRAVDADGRVCAVVLLAAWPRYVGR